ncbi:hypothetical protein TRIUR3_28377 [Triticum urartu]|uniref:Uncharacterized protein n=1 Tax=Triticum urartu TaxID=4572 RepID=M7ZCH6_TRIUA|nr:hypothetical protein TRIUR3_28377 [Triticum urartu]
MEVVASPSRFARRGIHDGLLQGPAMEVAAGSTAEEPRSAARSAAPRPAKASAEADKARRKAKALTKQREDLRARLAYRKRARELTSMPAKATAGAIHSLE